MNPTKLNFELFLNDYGIPEHEKESLGGNIPDHEKYGSWLRRNNPNVFENLYNVWKYEQENSFRICSECNSEMKSGYVIENGMEYYCSDNCLEKNMTKENFEELYDNGNGNSYWTEW